MDEFEIRSQAEYRDALAYFPYPLEIVHGDDALDAFERLKASGAGAPVILGGASEFTIVNELLERNSEEHASVDLVLERAAELEFPASFRAIEDRRFELWARQNPDLARNIKELLPGDWPAEVVGDAPSLTVAYDYDGAPWPRVHIAIPCDDWTAIPAFIHAGGWNCCPEAAVMVSALRSWRDRFGAELVGFSHDVMNLRVSRPPCSRDEALALAREHELFCSDVLIDVTLAELAARLIADDWWHFWWD